MGVMVKTALLLVRLTQASQIISAGPTGEFQTGKIKGQDRDQTSEGGKGESKMERFSTLGLCGDKKGQRRAIL